MLDKKQEQQVDQGGTAIQAGGNVTIHTGLTYAEVRDVALDVFRANFYELAGLAKETARARAEEITEGFLSRLQKEHPLGFGKANDPDFQYALFTVQKEYARTGDKDLGDLLVDLLVDRSKQEQRDILQIVLNESLVTAPKLTNHQLSVLSLVFVLVYARTSSVLSHELLGDHFDRCVRPFIPNLVKNRATYQHLEFTGCGSIGAMEIKLESILGITYPGLFMLGFDPQEVTARSISVGLDSQLFIPCLNNPSKLQVGALDEDMLNKALEAAAIPADDRSKIRELFKVGKMNDTQIKEKCIEIRPYMTDVFEAWSESAMKNFTLTSVGIAIGHANIKRLIGDFANLSIWIN